MKRLLSVVSFIVVLSLLLVACGNAPTQPVDEVPVTGEEAPGGAETLPVPGDEGTADTPVPMDEETPEPGAVAEGTATPEAGAEAGPTPTATSIVAEAGTGSTRLIYWNGLTGSDGKTMVEMVQNYAQESPEVSVRVEMMPWGTYFEKLLTALVSGSPPDLFLLHEFEIPQFASQGVLGDTGDFFSSGGGPIPSEDFEPRVMEALQFEGGTYGVPLDVHGWGVWTNKDLFTDAGVDPETAPANAEEFVTMCKRLTVDTNGARGDEEGFDPENVDVWGTVASWMKPNWLSVLWQNGGDWHDGTGQTATINTPEGKAALQFWYDLIYVHHCAPPPAGYDTWQGFAGGKIAMIPEGSWFLNFATENNINWGVWEYPKLGTEQPAVWTSSHVIYTPATLEGENLEAAKTLITYLTENTDIWATSGQPPARLSVRESLSADELPSTVVFANSFGRQGRYDYPHPCITEIIDQGYMPEWDAALNNLKTVDQALTDAQNRVQEIMDRCQ